MKPHNDNRMIRLLRALVRCALRLPVARVPERPRVYLCRHANLRGPLGALVALTPMPRVWALAAFTERSACAAHYRAYTLTKRYGWPRALAAPVAALLGRAVPRLMRSVGAIPVHRGSACVLMTFRESLAALKAGQSILLCPDIDYRDGIAPLGSLYDGYLLLAALYRNATNKALPFVPIAVKKRVVLGAPLYLVEGESRADASARVRAALMRLEQPLPHGGRRHRPRARE